MMPDRLEELAMRVGAVRHVPAHWRNFTPGRAGAVVDTVVIHTTEGGGAPEWFADPRSGASAHYVLLRNGDLVQCVSEADTAWACGHREWNRRSISIEVEGFSRDAAMWTGNVTWPLTKLLVDLCRRHDIAAKRALPGIAGHCDIPSPNGPGFGGAGGHTDPGRFFPWDDVLNDVDAILHPPTLSPVA
jgi:N-acetyl-anhydromuramyl-L-alanine amidase AmpD